MAKLTQTWVNDDTDSIRDAIIDNVCALISSRAPLWRDYSDTEVETIQGSIVHLGIRHFTPSQSKANVEVILADISELIRLYEPRLTQVSLELTNKSSTFNHLQFRISAIMHSAAGSETTIFDSVLNFSSNKLDVRKSNFV
ncbi:type VI secretion system baseplate subunit TssE [Parashewanella spongiae]|nr:type VI secretion system baseplate subunit TssE [Parashewanella spongiae]MCL1078175.1 type VI secretion system baseplate subunit TssE [Parashewanella spongiae]